MKRKKFSAEFDDGNGPGAGELRLDLFSGDGWNRMWAALGLPAEKDTTDYRRRVSSHTGRRVLICIAATWGIMAALAVSGGVWNGRIPRECLLFDFSAHVQMLIAIPLFLVAEESIAGKLAGAPRCFLASDLIAEGDQRAFRGMVARTNRIARHGAWDVLAVVLGYGFTLPWFLTEGSNGIGSWHALIEGGRESYTWAGWWDGLVAVPLFQALLYRWGIKVALWSWFLFRASRYRLRLVSAHPDEAGGLGFVGEFQADFGLLLFAVGSFVAAIVGYKISIEGAAANDPFVLMPIFGYVIAAPITFMLPLLFFLGALRKLKYAGRQRYAMLVTRLLGAFERAQDEVIDAAKMSDEERIEFLIGRYEGVKQLRLVPFDLRSLSRLFAYAASPMVPLLPKIVPEGTWLGDVVANVSQFLS